MPKSKLPLGLDQVLKASKRRCVDVDVPRLGGSVRLREPSAADVARIEETAADASDFRQGAELLALCWVGEDNQRLFVGDEGIAALEEMPVEVLVVLVPKATALCGLSTTAIEGAVKNSD